VLLHFEEEAKSSHMDIGLAGCQDDKPGKGYKCRHKDDG